MPPAHIVLEPRDGLFFKDGRGWHTSASGRGRALPWPFPPTLLGAMRTAYGRRLELARATLLDAAGWRRETAGVTLTGVVPLRRPMDANTGWEPTHRMWPVPSDALFAVDGAVSRLEPEPPLAETLGTTDESAREKLWQPALPERVKPGLPPRFLPEADFLDWLIDERMKAPAEDKRESLDLGRRVDIHLSIAEDTATAIDGALYSNEILETITGRRFGPDDDRFVWGIGLRATLPEAGVAGDVWTLGGDRRLARAIVGPDDLFAPPLDRFKESSGIRLFVVTPALFDQGWLLEGFALQGDRYRGRLPGVDGELELKAAYVGRPQHLSGWDMAATPPGPKPTQRLVPPGSVYFLRKTKAGATFGVRELESLWLVALGGKRDEGLGCVVAGRWTPEA